MDKRRIVGILALALLTLTLPARPARANSIWDWMQEWSGPGPFTDKHSIPPLFATLFCTDDYYEAARTRTSGAGTGTPGCYYFRLRHLESVEGDNYPVPTKVTMFDAGVVTKPHVWRLLDSVEIGAGLGFMVANTDAGFAPDGRPIGDGRLARMTITLPIIAVKPGLAVAEVFFDKTPKSVLARKVLSVVKIQIGGSFVVGPMSSENLGVPDDVRHFSSQWEYLMTRDIIIDLGELLFPYK